MTAKAGVRYQLVAKNSSKCVTLSTASTATGVSVVQETCTDYTDPTSQWFIEPAGDGYFRLISLAGGGAIDNGGSLADGALVAQKPYAPIGSDQWRIVDVGGGYYKIVARNSTKCLEVPGSSTADAVQLDQRACVGGMSTTPTADNQLFLLQVPATPQAVVRSGDFEEGPGLASAKYSPPWAGAFSITSDAHLGRWAMNVAAGNTATQVVNNVSANTAYHLSVWAKNATVSVSNFGGTTVSQTAGSTWQNLMLPFTTGGTITSAQLSVTGGTVDDVVMTVVNASLPSPPPSTGGEPCTPTDLLSVSGSYSVNSTGAACVKVTGSFTGWSSFNCDGRTLSLNNVAQTKPNNGNSTLPAKVNNAWYFNFSSGSLAWCDIQIW
jgi:hypothetical protein